MSSALFWQQAALLWSGWEAVCVHGQTRYNLRVIFATTSKLLSILDAHRVPGIW